MKFYIKLISLIALIVYMSSCDNISNPSESITDDGIMSFSSFEDYDSVLFSLPNLSDEELIEWVNGNGFTSRGILAIEAYNNTVAEFLNDSSIQNLKNRILDNEYLLLAELDSGDYEIEYLIDVNPNKYFANSKGVFIIGDTVAKVFNDYTILSNHKNLAYMESMDKSEVESLEENDEFIILKHNVQPSQLLKSTQLCIGNNDHRSDEGKSGKNKVKIRLITSEMVVGGYVTSGYVGGYVLAQKRTWGVWINAKRTLKASFKIKFQRREYNQWKAVKNAEHYNTVSNKAKYEFFILHNSYNRTNTTPSTTNLKVMGYNIWGSQGSVPEGKRRTCNY